MTQYSLLCNTCSPPHTQTLRWLDDFLFQSFSEKLPNFILPSLIIIKILSPFNYLCINKLWMLPPNSFSKIRIFSLFKARMCVLTICLQHCVAESPRQYSRVEHETQIKEEINWEGTNKTIQFSDDHCCGNRWF